MHTAARCAVASTKKAMITASTRADPQATAALEWLGARQRKIQKGDQFVRGLGRASQPSQSAEPIAAWTPQRTGQIEATVVVLVLSSIYLDIAVMLLVFSWRPMVAGQFTPAEGVSAPPMDSLGGAVEVK